MRLAALLFACSLHAADWTLLRVPGIDLYTNASNRTARQTIDRLEQIRSLLGSPANPEPIPLRVILFAKRSEYLPFAPDDKAAGFYQPGPERDYIVTSAGTPIDRVVAHEYVHFASHEPRANKPAWLEEGLAGFYSTFDGKQVGAPIREYQALLEQKTWLTADEMNAPRLMDSMFYAQSWALVHMLRREPQFPDRITPAMLTELRRYLPTLRPVAVKIPTSMPATLPAEPVSPLNALLLRADLALRTQHPGLAHKLYTQAAREYPNSSSAATGLATLAFADGDRENALKQLHRAVELNDRDPQAWFELAVIQSDDQALEKVVQLDSNFAQAHVLLGVRATDAGNLDAALQHLQQATALMPRKSYAWYSLGYAQQKRGDTSGARRSLQQALLTATSPEQRSMAATLLDSLP